MKKLMLFVLTGLFALSFMGCKKDYTCTCNISATGYSETLTYTFKESNKKANDNCDEYKAGAISSAKAIGYSDASANCTLSH